MLDQRFAAALPLVCEFLGVGDLSHPALRLDPEVRQRQLLDVMRHVTSQASGRQPTVTMIEDLHWLDPASAEFLEHMVEAQAGSRNLLLVNFRPEYRAEWMQKSWYRQIPLTPLAREAVAQLLGDLLGHDPSINTLADLIHARTGGNPFFTEEVAQSLIESGNLEGARGAYRLVTPIERLEVPATVQAVLAARIDRLPEREKRLLQIASVIGKDFPEPLLAAVATLPVVEMKSSLAALRRAEFIHEQALFPVVEYAFKHPLTQEVALGSQLKERRRRLHAAVARAIEQQDAERLDERAALLAQHWEDAGNALEAARWHRRAAHRTEDTDPSESLRRWHKVRALLADAAVSPEMTALRIQACRGILSALWRVGGTEVDSVFAEGKALAEQAGDLRSLAMFFTLYGNAKGTAGDLRAYRAHASEALRLAELTGDLVLQAAISSDAAHPFGWTGRLREAVQLAEKGIALGPEDLSLGQDLFGVGAYLLGLSCRGAALVEMGRFDEAASDLDRAGQYPAAEPSAFIWSQMFHAVRAYRAGDAPGALTHARRALERAEESGVPIFLILAQVALGIALVANREWRGVEKAGLRALALAREHGVGFGMTARALFFLAEAKLGQGDPHAALALADEALVDARQSGGRLFELDALLTRARAVLSAEGASGAAEVARTLAAASALIDETGARCGEPIVHEVSAELARVCGDEGSRERELYAAHRLFAEMGATGHAERVAQLLAESPR